MSFEILLPVGAIGLYLFDSLLLMYSNELLFVRTSGQWDFTRGSALLIAGRRLYLPNPFTPHIPQFRVRWSETDPRRDTERQEELQPFMRALRPVQVLVMALLLLLLVLPVVLYVYGTGLELLVLMACFYLVVLAMLGTIFAHRRSLRLTGRSFAAVAFDSLACGPFAVNAVRKLCMRRSLAGNPIEFARASFGPARLTALIDAISASVVQEQQREDGQTERWLQLESFRSRLAALRPSL